MFQCILVVHVIVVQRVFYFIETNTFGRPVTRISQCVIIAYDEIINNECMALSGKQRCYCFSGDKQTNTQTSVLFSVSLKNLIFFFISGQ